MAANYLNGVSVRARLPKELIERVAILKEGVSYSLRHLGDAVVSQRILGNHGELQALRANPTIGFKHRSPSCSYLGKFLRFPTLRTMIHCRVAEARRAMP